MLALLSACTQQSLADQSPTDLTALTDDQPTKVEKDTSLQLKYITGVRSILEDSKGNIWFGSHQEGVCKFDGESFTFFTKKDGLSDNQVRSIQEDQQGNIWFGTGQGVTSYDGSTFTIYPQKDVLGLNSLIAAKWQSKPTDLWFNGNREEGVYRYDGQSLSYLAFPVPENKEEQSRYMVTSIAKGRDGKVWFGTYPSVLGFDGTSLSGKPADFTIINNATVGLNKESGWLHIRSVFEDSKGNLWIGNNGIGVFYYDGDTTINFTAQSGLSNPDFLNHKKVLNTPANLARIFSIGEDKNGNIWFGTADSGVWRYDPSIPVGTSAKSLKNYTQKDGLTSPHVWAIYQNKRGDLWLAMGDGSVCQFNPSAEQAGEKPFDRIF